MNKRSYMKKQSMVAVMVTVFCLGAFLAEAQPYPYPPPSPYVPSDSGPYFRLGLGPSVFQNGTLKQFSFQGSAPFSPQNQSVNYNVGLAFDAGMGYAFNKYFGLDFETGIIEARINNVPGYYSNGSYVENVPLLVNGTLSLPIPHTCIVPYIGAGGGGSISIFDANGFGDQGGTAAAYGSVADAVFAWQGFAGVRFMVSQNISVGLGYKYFQTQDTLYSYPPGPNLNIGLRGVRTHSVLFTVQFNF
jgi:opacity protein-like surface antigen